MSVYGRVHASYYAQFRPNPPEQIIRCVLNYLEEKLPDSRHVAVDAGCGPGQCASLLAARFERVYGYDVSADQIDKATSTENPDNLYFAVSSMESTPLADQSVDLVTCSQSLHWFDLNKFYPEVRRILKPGGVLAAFGYFNTPSVYLAGDTERSTKLSKLIDDTYNHPNLSKHWVKKLKVVDSGYRNLEFPFGDRRENSQFQSAVNLFADDLIGFVQTWSDFHRCQDANADEANDIKANFNGTVRQILGDVRLDQIKLELRFSHFLTMGRNAQLSS